MKIAKRSEKAESKNRPVATNFQFLKILAPLGQLLVGACLPQTLLGTSTANWNFCFIEITYAVKNYKLFKRNTIISNDIQKVWNIVLAVDKYNSWRSDLSKTEIINDKQFIEYTKNGYATTFTVTVAEPYKRWEFDMENSNMKGHWIGVFIDKGNETQIDFTENVIPKKWFMKPFVKTYLKKQQKQFVLDLKKALE